MKIKMRKHCTIADDNNGRARSSECRFIETKSPSLIQLHRQHQHRQLKASLDDAVMHFSPPSKDSINTDFTNLNANNESGRNSVSRQSLIGEFAVVITKSVVGLLRLCMSAARPFSKPETIDSSIPDVNVGDFKYQNTFNTFRYS